MKKLIKKTIAAVLAGSMMLSFYSCKDENQYSDPIDDMSDMREDELPYGATIVKLSNSINDKVKITVEYDRRFMTEDEAIIINDYVAALNTNDGAVFDKIMYPDQLEQIKQEGGFSTTNDYVKSLTDDLKKLYLKGDDFEFDYILINDCKDESYPDTETSFSALDKILDSYATANGKETVSSRTTKRRMYSVQLFYTLKSKGGSYSLTNRVGSDQLLYIYEIDGKLYLL